MLCTILTNGCLLECVTSRRDFQLGIKSTPVCAHYFQPEAKTIYYNSYYSSIGVDA